MGWTMANTAAKSSGLKRFLLHHEIPDYPTGGRRMAYLGLAVLATITIFPPALITRATARLV